MNEQPKYQVVWPYRELPDFSKQMEQCVADFGRKYNHALDMAIMNVGVENISHRRQRHGELGDELIGSDGSVLASIRVKTEGYVMRIVTEIFKPGV